MKYRPAVVVLHRSTRARTFLCCLAVILQAAVTFARDAGYPQHDAAAPAKLEALWTYADLNRQRGKPRQAMAALDDAQRLSTEPVSEAITQLYRGGVLLTMGLPQDAEAVLVGLIDGAATLPASAQVRLYNELGAVEATLENYDAAATRFAEAARRARSQGLMVEATKAVLNESRAKFDGKDLAGFERTIQELDENLVSVGSGEDRSEILLGSADLRRRAMKELDFPASWRADARAMLEEVARSTTSAGQLAYARGFLGAIYEDEGELDAALRETRKAIFIAQGADAPEQLYRWEWQIARLEAAKGSAQRSEDAYGHAIDTLERVRSDLSLRSRDTFERLIEPVYSGDADALLRHAASLPAGEEQQRRLREVRDLLEKLKQAEVANYFGAECIAFDRNKIAPARADTAIVYPVLLEDRAEILVERNGRMARYVSHVGRNEVTREIRALRGKLEHPESGDTYLTDSRKLYDVILRPAEPSFIGIKTLVIVPAGSLRTIPLSVLNDGQQFVLERFALATTPAMDLTRPAVGGIVSHLVVGALSESRQGFPALPNVKREVDAVAAHFASVPLRDAQFQRAKAEAELSNVSYDGAHFATHGEFNRDYRKSFILTYDDRLTLSDLQRTLDQRIGAPLDLLVLSACKTAAGDDRAALGLAGVAVQSGARTAVASLWSISDAATAELMGSFYDHLRAGHETKAESLRQAQLVLLRKPRYSHPSYWAPFLLIGNWL